MSTDTKVRGGKQIEMISSLASVPNDDPTLTLFRGIHQELIELKPTEEYEKLRKALALGTNALDIASLAKSIDESSKNYFIASTLYFIARKHLVLYRIILRKELAELRRQARSGIKGDGDRVTNDAIEDFVAAHFSERYSKLVAKEQDLENIRDTLEALRDAWRDRTKQLNTLNDLEKRKKPAFTSGMNG